MDQTLTIFLIAAFFAWMLYIGYRTHVGRSKTEMNENFLIGNRNVGAFLVVAGTVMGWVDAFQFGFLPSMAFDMGWSVFWYIIAIPAAFLVLAAFAGQIRQRAAADGAYMVGNFFSKLFSQRFAAGVGLVMFVYFFIWMSIQFMVGGKVLHDLTGLPFGLVIGVMGVVTLSYMMLGGFLASIKTDLAQFCIFVVFAASLIFLWAPSAPAWVPAGHTVYSTGLGLGLTLLVVNLFSTLVAPDVWQRIYSADSAADARRSMLMLAVAMTLMLSFFAGLGLIIKGMGFAAAGTDVATAVFTHLVPAWLMPLAVIALMAALMSTIATTLFGSAMTVASDMLVELKVVRRASLPVVCRWLMVGLLAAALGLASVNIDLMTLALTCLSATSIVAPYIPVVLKGWKVSEAAAFYSLLISIVVFFTGMWFDIYTGALALLPMFVSTGALLLLEGLLRKPSRKR